jgi:hypothetical protein
MMTPVLVWATLGLFEHSEWLYGLVSFGHVAFGILFTRLRRADAF